ncbi:MAG: 30S ribosomal protein S2 [Patescibacteria group bacterium]
MSKKEHKIPELLDMMQAGVHFGHTTSRWHPKMEQYIYAVRQGIHIIDLEQTAKRLEQALDFLFDTVASGKSVLWIGTKKQGRDIVRKYASETQSPYVVDKWLGGTFTNFDTIQNLIKKLEKLEEERDQGKHEKYTKKEQLEFQREIDRLTYLVGGIRTMKTLPGAVFMIDLKEDKTPRLEAHTKKVPVVGVVDTNINPTGIEYPVPGNDDAVRSLELFCSCVAHTINEAQAVYAKKQAESAQKADKPNKPKK